MLSTSIYAGKIHYVSNVEISPLRFRKRRQQTGWMGGVLVEDNVRFGDESQQKETELISMRSLLCLYYVVCWSPVGAILGQCPCPMLSSTVLMPQAILLCYSGVTFNGVLSTSKGAHSYAPPSGPC